MDYILVVFSSRSETLSFSNFLNKIGFKAQVISTPKELSGSCGLSVKFSVDSLIEVEKLLKQRGILSFSGMYRVSIKNGKQQIIKIR